MNFDLGLVSSSLDSSIHVWDVESGQKLKTMENGPMECWTGMVPNSILFLIAFRGKSHRLASFPQTQIRLDTSFKIPRTLSIVKSMDDEIALVTIFDVVG